MAAKKKATYESKAVINKITATSRVSTKIGETFFTVEYSEERIIPEDADIVRERELIWDAVNTEVDNQIDDIYNLQKKSKK